jgi:hypothetical protein
LLARTPTTATHLLARTPTISLFINKLTLHCTKEWILN